MIFHLIKWIEEFKMKNFERKICISIRSLIGSWRFGYYIYNHTDLEIYGDELKLLLYQPLKWLDWELLNLNWILKELGGIS